MIVPQKKAALCDKWVHSASARQQEVLERIARGQTNPEIAADLGIAFETVKMHVANILSELDVSSREEAAALYHSGDIHRIPARRSWLASPLIRLAGGTAGLAATIGLAALLVVSLRSSDEESPGAPGASPSPSAVASDLSKPLPLRNVNVEWEYAAPDTGLALVAADAQGVVASFWVPTNPGEGTGLVVSIDGKTGSEQWKVTLPCVPFTAALDADRAHVPCNDGAIYALDRNDGHTLWRTETRTSPLAPVIGDGLLFLDSADPDGAAQMGVDPKYYGNGDIIALDLTTGVERWRVPTGAEDVYVAYGDGRVYAISGSNSSRPTALQALDATTGKVAWTAPVEGGRHAPRLYGGAVFVASSSIFSFDAATGKLNWKADRFAHDIVVARNAVTGVSSYGSDAFFGLDASTGDELWLEDFCDCAFHPVTDGEVMYIGGVFGAFDPRYGTPALTSDDDIRSAQAPAVVGEWIYTGTTNNGTSQGAIVQGIR